MVYKYRITLAGLKGFFRVYAVNALNSLYTFHKQLRSDLEFPMDQPILFKALDEEGAVVARYALVDLGFGTVDAVTIADPATDATLLDYANQSGKPVLPYEGNNPESYLNFFKGLL